MKTSYAPTTDCSQLVLGLYVTKVTRCNKICYSQTKDKYFNDSLAFVQVHHRNVQSGRLHFTEWIVHLYVVCDSVWFFVCVKNPYLLYKWSNNLSMLAVGLVWAITVSFMNRHASRKDEIANFAIT